MSSVLPPVNKVAAILEEATARAISPLFRTLAKMRLRRRVFPVPPGASKKKYYQSLEKLIRLSSEIFLDLEAFCLHFPPRIF
ncbi:hypothetical protein TNCT_263601 [Trichonephila clavata]|uniref:Uncharacterized protein n=1 Tax=Trichonephila clavata TaxID=2740835 RepID=A0A8X6H345_TRICU|nr:hypothetical protein TNCT_263601 [Trichonephila clavata]